jgi:hypothetical protein
VNEVIFNMQQEIPEESVGEVANSVIGHHPPKRSP